MSLTRSVGHAASSPMNFCPFCGLTNQSNILPVFPGGQLVGMEAGEYGINLQCLLQVPYSSDVSRTIRSIVSLSIFLYSLFIEMVCNEKKITGKRALSSLMFATRKNTFYLHLSNNG